MQEDKTIIKVSELDVTSKYTKKKLAKLQEKKLKATIILSNCYKKQNKHKTKQNKDIEDLNKMINNTLLQLQNAHYFHHVQNIYKD